MLVWSFGTLLGVSSYAVSTLSTDGLIFARGFLPGVQVDKTLDALSSLAFICLFVVLDPSDLKATIVVAPGQIPGNFLPFPDTDCLPFLVKLVHVYRQAGHAPRSHQ